MTPRQAIDELISMCWFESGAHRSGGLRAYLGGDPAKIPDMLLPGRRVERFKRNVPGFAEAISKLTSDDMRLIRPDVVKVAVEMTPTPHTFQLPPEPTRGRRSRS